MNRLVRHIAAKFAIGIDKQDHLGLMRCEQRDVVLVPLPGIVAENEFFLLRDLQPKLLGGFPKCLTKRLIAGELSLKQQQVPPLLGDEVLRQTIGQHRVAGDCMHQVGSALVAAQLVSRFGDVKEQQNWQCQTLS